MRGPYSDYAAPPVYLYPDTPRPGVHFSRTELIQLGVAILALSAAFTLAYIRSDLFSFTRSPAAFLVIILAAAIGLIYGAPGATMISGAVNRQQNGRISAAGPASNLVICAGLFAAFWVVARTAPDMFGGLVFIYLLQVAQINAVLAGFNLVPIMPLDGAKVFAWNKAAYAGLVAAAVGMVILTLFYTILL